MYIGLSHADHDRGTALKAKQATLLIQGVETLEPSLTTSNKSLAQGDARASAPGCPLP